MPKITTTISYEDEEFGNGEVCEYTRNVEDLDVMDWLWYQLKVAEVAGFSVKDLHFVTGNGTFYSTEE